MRFLRTFAILPLLASALALVTLVSACESRAGRTVVLYTSVDSDVLTDVLARFERDSGIKVLLVGDTEATKTTGLVERLLLEKSAPKADVWWSSEALGSITLAKQGILQPMTSELLTEAVGDRSAINIAADRSWVGFAARARVVAFNTKAVSSENPPRTLADLLDPRFKGRVGMARPQFGTTRTHIAALVAATGEAATHALLLQLKANGLRLYDGNSSIVRAIAEGEIDAGATDTDDVWAAQANNWPVDFRFESSKDVSSGTLLIPNTVGLIAGAPHPHEAERLLAYLLSPEVERLLATSRSRNIPTDPEVAKDFPSLTPTEIWGVNSAQIADSLPAADRLIAELFPLSR